MRRRMEPSELRTADEVLLASTSVCLLPVVECDGQHNRQRPAGPNLRPAAVGLERAGRLRRRGSGPAIHRAVKLVEADRNQYE